MTITYTAGTNLITLDDSAGAGDSWGTAYDMEDVLSNCGAVVTKQGANAYDVSARLKFLSGVYFVSKSEFVELKPNPINPAYTIQIDSGAHVQLGDYNSTDKYSYNGSFWRIYTNGTTGGTSGNVIFGEFLQYGSNVWNDAGSYTLGIHFKAGATIRQYNSIMTARSYFWATDHDLQDVKWYQPSGGQYAMLVASGFDFNWAGLTTMGCNFGLFFSGTTTSDVDLYAPLILDATSSDIQLDWWCKWLIRVINPVVHPTSISGTGSGQPGCQICYTFNIKVVDTNGAGVVCATVELKDKNSDVVFTENTISGGVLANDEIVKTDWYKNAAQGGHLTYNDHTLKVTKGADVVEYNITIDHQIKEDIVLIPTPSCSWDDLLDGITDIKGDGFVKNTHSLVDIKDNLVIKSGTVSAVVSQYLEFNTNLSEATNNYWTRGAIRFTSGNNEGAIRKIQLYQGSNGYIELRTPLVNSIQTGDTFDIIPLRAFRINHEDVEQIVDETLDEVIANHGNAGSVGKSLTDIETETDKIQTDIIAVPNNFKANVSNLDVAVSTRNATTPPTTAAIKNELEGVGTKLTTVNDQTDRLQFAVGNDIKATLDSETVTTDAASRTASKATGFATATALSTHDTKLDTVDANVDRILKATEIKQCTVNDAGASTTKFITSLTETDNNFWDRGALRFTSGNNDGQVRAIKNYAGGTKQVTIQTPLNSAPANGDTFIILTSRKFLTPDIGDILEGITDIQGTGFVKDLHSLKPISDTVTTMVADTEAQLSGTHGAGSWESAAIPDIADAVWDEDLSGHTTAGTAGKILGAVKKIVNAILGLIA